MTRATFRTRFRQAFLAVCCLSTAWAALIWLTGGFTVRVLGVRLSSRQPEAAIALGVLSGLTATALATSGERRRALPKASQWIRGRLTRLDQESSRAAPAIAALASIAIIAVGIRWGTFVAGGADAYGYASQADLWARGNLHIEQPLMEDARWPFPKESLTPLGYRPSPDGISIVPHYSPGLPMLMGLFERIAGRTAVFYVVPLLGGLAVWATYLLGAALVSRWTGAAAAILLATAPVFLCQLLFPMTDVPVTTWCALMLLLLFRSGRLAAFGAGLAGAGAMLTRVNVAPLVVIPACALLWAAWRERSLSAGAGQQLLWFTAGVVPGFALIAAINASLYGSALTSGYGPAGEIAGLANIPLGLVAYAQFVLFDAPFLLLAIAAPFVLRPRPGGSLQPDGVIVCLLFSAAVFGGYLLAPVFALRYVMPAFPPLFVLAAGTLSRLAEHWAADRGRAVAAAMVIALGGYSVYSSVAQGVFNYQELERKSPVIGAYIAEHLPANAALLSMEMSGSARYYSGRMTVRIDHITARELEPAFEQLRVLGYHPYILVEDWEEQMFKDQYASTTPLGRLDWLPVAQFDGISRVRIYDPLDRGSASRAPDILK